MTPARSPGPSSCRSPTAIPAATRDAITKAAAAGFGHLVLSLPAPYPEHVAQWVASELIGKVATEIFEQADQQG